MSKAKGVFCLENDWWGDLKHPSTVEPILELLRKHRPNVPYIHLNVDTKDALAMYLGKWMQKTYRTHPILYLAFHGWHDSISLGFGRQSCDVSLDELADLLEGRCSGRIIHFTSCGTLNVHGHRLNRFLRTTGALAVSGYKGEVDWLTSTAFDLLLLSAMQTNKFTVAGARAIKNRVRREMAYQSKVLNFRMIIRKAKRRIAN